MIDINDLKGGLTILVDRVVYLVTEAQPVKPGKGAAFVRTRLKNLKTGSVIERTFRSGEKLEEAFVEERRLQFLYGGGGTYHFMDEKTYDQVALDEERVGQAADLLKENMVVTVQEYNGQLLSFLLPMFVELKVVEAEPGLRGDTAKGGAKTVTVETGATIQVPLFIQEGDLIKIDTRSRGYVGRVG